MNDRKSYAWAEAELKKLNTALIENGCPKTLTVVPAVFLGERDDAYMIDWSELPEAFRKMLINWSMQVSRDLSFVGGETGCCGFIADTAESLRLDIQALNKIVRSDPKGMNRWQQTSEANQA